jgi:hypothetical protein
MRLLAGPGRREDNETRQQLWCPLLDTLIESHGLIKDRLQHTDHEYWLVMQDNLKYG